MKHYLCIKDREIDGNLCFKEGKVYSGRHSTNIHDYVAFTNEQGESHPMEQHKLDIYFKEVQIGEPTEISLEDKRNYLHRKIKSIRSLLATGAVKFIAVNKLKRDIEIIEAILNDLEQLAQHKTETQTQTQTPKGMSRKEYEGVMIQLDDLKHFNHINTGAYRYLREVFTNLYKGQDN